MKIALLSNVNMNFVIRSLKKDIDIFEPEGYGNELGFLQNPGSTYHAYDPDITFFVMDFMELTGHALELQQAKEKVDYWFATLEKSLRPGRLYYISDVRLFGPETLVVEDAFLEKQLLGLWDDALSRLMNKHTNVRLLPYGKLLDRLGADGAYSVKTWYLGKILLSTAAQSELAKLLLDCVRVETYVPKKVLVLDLDNTLWGGLAGESTHTPVTLSDDHNGLAYKNLQRVLLQMQKQGVLLCICSKNNEEDAGEIIENHPHMVLRPDCFASMKINWNSKPENLQEIAKELNLGPDSFVFFDDSGAERELMKTMLPQVIVPDFPENPQNLASAMVEIYNQYFKKSVLTREDLEKTKQYAQNQKREQLKSGAASFEEYLAALKIEISRVDARKHAERLLQLLNKTNQFNLTTIRHTEADLQELLTDLNHEIYLFNVKDSFGDNGIVAALIVELGTIPQIREFVMSCRVMGRNVEMAILDYVEKDLAAKGYEKLIGRYEKTAKNVPVENLYLSLGYEETSKAGAYLLDLSNHPKRVYVAEIYT